MKKKRCHVCATYQKVLPQAGQTKRTAVPVIIVWRVNKIYRGTRTIFSYFFYYFGMVFVVYSIGNKNTTMTKTIDIRSLWRVQPIIDGNATNETFFKWLHYNIFSSRFKDYEGLYENVLWYSFAKDSRCWQCNTYAEYGESAEDKARNMAEMREWLDQLKDYERPRFFIFPNKDYSNLNAKYMIQARIGYDNSKAITIFSNKMFKSFALY